MFFLLEALVREGRFDALIDTIREYWGKQIDAGATTFWEMYHEGEARLTRSHCHGLIAAPTFFLTQQVLGVQPAEAGYATVLIAPKPGKLTSAKGRVPTARGAVACEWSRSDRKFELTVESPAPMRVELPVEGKIAFVEGSGDVQGSRIISQSPRLKLVVSA